MRGISEDWLSRTIRTVEAVMERHGFQEDVTQETELSAEQPCDTDAFVWNKLLRRFTRLLPL
jgi:hypothetical protein